MNPPPAPNSHDAGLHSRALRGAAWSVLNQAGTQLISVAVWMVLGRTISPGEVGLVSLAQLVITFLMIFLEQGYSEALVQKKEMTRDDENTAFWTVLGVGLLLAALTNLIAGPVAQWKNEPALESMLRVLSLGFPLMSFRTVPEAVLIRSMRMNLLAVRSMVATALAGATGVGMALAGFGAWSLVGQAVVMSASGSILLWWLSGWRPGFHWKASSFRALAGFGVHITGTNLMAYLNRRIDQWLVEHFYGKVVLGTYQMAQRWVEVQAALLGQGLNQIALSAFSRVQTDPARLAKGWVQASGLTIAVAAPMMAGLAATAPDVLRILVGPQWLSAAPIMALLCWGSIMQIANYLASRALLAAGKPGWNSTLTAINVVLNLVLMLSVARRGPEWIAGAFSLRAWLIAPLVWFAVHRAVRPDWKVFFASLAGPLVCAGLMAVVVRSLSTAEWLIPWHALPRLAVVALVGGAVYGVLLRVLAPESWQRLLHAGRRLRGGGGAAPKVTEPPGPTS